MNRKAANGGRGATATPSLSSASSAAPAAKKIASRPHYSRFTQQELPACNPILTPALVVSSFLIIAIIFIPIGLSSLSASDNVVEIVHRYDQHCLPPTCTGHYQASQFIQSSDTDKTCITYFTVPEEMKSPIFIYYQLDNFYQNHRRYVKSRNDEQLRSKDGESVTKGCDPESTSANNGPIVPCGLIAWSLFNDTYRFSVNSKVLEVNKKNIAWTSDREHKFGSDVYPKNFQNGSLIGGAKLNSSIPLSEQEDLIVWMRTGALPSFRKLYGRIEQDLEANNVIRVVIENNYNTYGYGGKKRLILSTTSWIGGKNEFLGVAYLAIGGLSLLLAITFIFVYVFMSRPIGDPSYLTWNRHPLGYKK